GYALRLHRLAHEVVDLKCLAVSGSKEVGTFEEDRVDLVAGNEAFYYECLVGLRHEVADLLWGQDDRLALAGLVTLDQVFIIDAAARVGVDIFPAHAMAGIAVDYVERDAFLRGDSRIERHRAGEFANDKIASPDCPRCQSPSPSS